ncbi:MAG: hypothetical protein GXO91_08170 [FCB group bacterium]|nr:hypothetical protein [FCB group bacterium]
MSSLKFVTILIFLLLLTSLSAEEYLVRVNAPDAALSSWIAEHQIETTFTRGKTYIDLYINEEQRSHLVELNYDFSVINTKSGFLRDLSGYRDYQTLTSDLENIAATYSSITSLSSLGPSQANLYFQDGNAAYTDYQHEIWVLKLSDNPDVEEDEPNIFFVSETHAREPISLEVDMNLLNYLLAAYGTDEQITNWINSTQIWFVPLINPDGHKLVIDGTHLMHRKNMRDNNLNGLPDLSATDGVDLNRNFGYVWGDNGSSDNPQSQLYHGPNAWSEPETVYIRDLIQAHKFYAGITYHSYGEYVLYPLGHLPGANSYDHDIMGDLAVQMAAVTPRISGSGNYQPMQSVNFGYTCQGTLGDWAYAQERVFSFTIELAGTFIPPAYQVPTICQDNLAGAMLMLDRVNYATVTGHITDNAGNPLVAEVHVTEIDEQAGMTPVEPVRSDSTFGRYYRLLQPGSYTFTFSKQGYFSQSESAVVVTDSTVTQLDVVLTQQIPGDIDQNGILNVTDIVFLVSYILGDIEPTAEQFDAGDISGDNNLTVVDIVMLVDLILFP